MKPILFSTEMVTAILEGRKTVTRRIVKPQPPSIAIVEMTGRYVVWKFWADDPSGHLIKPPYNPGDILYVRETWRVQNVFGDIARGDRTAEIKFMAGGETVCVPAFDYTPSYGAWKPSIHMPKKVARIFLRVKDVRVERLQDIDGLGAFDEGAVAEMPLACLPPKKPNGFDGWSEDKQNDHIRLMATSTYIAKIEFANRLIKAFSKVWDSTIKKPEESQYGWNANPWVFVYEFERISKEEAMRTEEFV